MATIFIESADYGPQHFPPSPNCLPHTLPSDAVMTPAADCTVRIRVNEATREIAYDNESENGVTLIVRPKASCSEP
jgi:hypothetical protein